MKASVQAAFRALADPSRRMMLVHLAERDMTIAEVAERFAMTRAAVKKHLTVLEQGKLISVRAEGRARINRLEPRALQAAADWMSHFDRFWDTRLERLKEAIEQEREIAMNATITKTVFFKAPRETVWAFLTRHDKLAAWFFAADADLALGQDFVLSQPGETGKEAERCWGKVLEMERPARLVYSFTIRPMNGVMSTVAWTLDEVLGGTRLTLEHSGLEKVEAALGLLTELDAGWDRHLGKLRGAAV